MQEEKMKDHELIMELIEGHLRLNCSCQFDPIYEHSFPVEYREMANVILAHLKTDTETAVKAMMKEVSFGDILRALRGMKK